MDVARIEARRHSLRYPFQNESDALSFAYEQLCILSVTYIPYRDGCFRKYFRTFLRLRFIDNLRSNGPQKRVQKNLIKSTESYRHLEYQGFESVSLDTPEALLIAHETAYRRGLTRNRARCKSRDARAYEKCLLFLDN